MRKIAVVGAGIMGSGLAQRFAMAGINVELLDNNPENLKMAIGKIRLSLLEAAQKGLIKENKVEDIINNIQGKLEIEKISDDVEVVIEAATENFENKIKIFQQLEDYVTPEAILATNTSCLSITDIAEHSYRKHKVIGMHFFYPAERNKLVEIIPTEFTIDETIRTVRVLAEMIDKISIKVKDTPGFCVNRFFVPYLNEAAKLLEDNVTSIYTINYAAKEAFKAPIGPFEIMNLTKPSLAYEAMKELYIELGEQYKPCNLLKEVAEGNNFWDLPEINKFNDMESAAFDITPEIKRHIQGLVFGICADLVSENTSKVRDINLGAKIGLGWKTGPFDLINEYGPSKVYALVADLAEKNKGFKVNPVLEEAEHWVINTTKYYVDNNMATIKLMRPDALNALNEQMFLDIDENLSRALKDPMIELIKFEGCAKIFAAGADLKFFIQNLEMNRMENIMEYTDLAHSVLTKIRNSPKPIISCIDGIAFGGGLELALASHFIVATERSTFQFPETGIGLFPGFGGTYNVPVRVGTELAKYLILLGYRISVDEALEFQLIDRKVKDYKELEDFITMLQSKTEVTPDYLIQQFRERVEYTDETKRNMKILRNIDLLITRKLVSKRARAMADELEKKSPVAINIANNLINLANKNTFEEALKLERSYICEAFNQTDILQRFKSVFKK
jgi:enoyl-CoA hydratase/3-hydroxyacyl-CoA dehydrogenase